MAGPPYDLLPPWPMLLAGVLALCLGGALSTLVVMLLSTRRRLLALDRDHERLGDEVWELRAGAEARNRAEAASEAKSRFLAMVSHEIRTPLNGILGLADLLTGTPLTREQQAYVAAVKTSGTALTTLIDEILDFARIESGRLDLAPEPFDVGELIEGIVELLGPQAQDKGLEIAAHVDRTLPVRLVGDAQRLRQVLLNLAGNAVKFTETGGVGVRVARTPGGSVRFSVSDTGPGIPADRRAAIFEEFEQVDGSTTRRHGGTGLGLAIAKRIIARMGGDLGLEDRIGGGSVFDFTVALPAAAEPETDRSDQVLLELDGSRALIVSTAPFQPGYLADTLRGVGATVIEVASADEALALMRYEPDGFDLLFVDCGLGERAARSLAMAAKTGRIGRSILLFSPFERRDFGEHVLTGFDAWLVKPVRQASLTARVRPGLPEQGRGTALDRPASTRVPRPIGMRVLLAEDNPINALIARTSLQRLGVEVTHAADGLTALDEAETALGGGRSGFDLILMDVCMPGLDGLDVTRRIRAIEARTGRPATRIVAMTAHAFDETLRECRLAGMDEVLTKPVEPAEFGRLVRERRQFSEAG